MNKSKTAYDYRRVIALVQVLAMGDFEAINHLCEQWSIPFEAFHTMYEPRNYISIATIQRLAQHALEYSRQEGK